ncbi:helix-turn-helix domain-containing protein, partial [Halorhodospira halochloris]|uniref:helix-turn-helix domain-containing protein n=1 Tax=Halorhodospira halochloris TaxID=1052 RepID=UPI001EE85FB4
MTENDRLSQLAKRMRHSFPALPEAHLSTYLRRAKNSNDPPQESEPAATPADSTAPAGADTYTVEPGDTTQPDHHSVTDTPSLISAVIAHRKRHGLTQQQLAARLGIS